MKIVTVTYGTRGDFQPCLALNLALRAAGHQTLLAGPPEHSVTAEKLGCPYRPLGDDFKARLDRFPNPHEIKAVLPFLLFLKKQMVHQFRELPALLEGADLVLGASLAVAAPGLAAALKIPYLPTLFCPQIIPSSHHPFWGLRQQTLPAWLNRLSWLATSAADPMGLKTLLNYELKKLGVKPQRNLWRYYLGDRIIVAADEILAPIPPDVKPQCLQTGSWHLTGKAELAEEVEDFLRQGEPPVYFGVGSMPNRQPEETARLVLQAAREAGVRLILSQGWGQLNLPESQPGVLVVGEAPHDRLFPRLAAVVHHGGGGTTAAAARAGVPQVVVPHIMDQYYWAHRVHATGLGPRPLPRSRLKASGLALAIRRAVNDRTIKQRAAEVGRILGSRDNLARTVELIESIASR